ncbi:LptF/LptG family permease [Flavobacteriaceae bacterium Ap0902]|nr:LptF/LptG family permease [Flavobacteriaceae bacterium Ap0902]
MLKKLDWYTIKTYFGPFIFIFSVLFFIFMVQFAWQEMDKFAGKGLSPADIGKLLFYLGLSVIQLVMPLTVLLSAIMTFGGFGERYELAAMKSTGISLGRIMLPLFILICMLSLGLYFFTDSVVPQSQRKARNMLLNIARTKPAVNFEPGVFVMGIPGINMKIDDNKGENGEFLEGVFIHMDASAYEDQRTIIANKGKIEPAEDKRFLKLALFDGYLYDDEVKGLTSLQLQSQPLRQVKFDTMVQYFDVSELVEKAIEEESVTDHYKFMTSKELVGRIDTLKLREEKMHHRVYRERIASIMPAVIRDSLITETTHIEPSINLIPLEEMSNKDRERIALNAIQDLERDIASYTAQKDEIIASNKFFAKHVLVLVRNYSNALMCIAFFLIGAPLGAIIRKGGVGMPVVVAIMIFILFYLVYMYSENLSKNGIMNPYWGAWLPVIVFFPVGIFFTYQAIRDSELFNIESYLKPFQKLFSIFGNKNKEHARYQ